MAVQSVDRAIDIVSLISHSSMPLGITEIYKALKLNKATVFGLVKTMVDRGLLEQDSETRKYRLGPTMSEWGTARNWSMRIYQAAVYPLRRLSENIQRSARLYHWDRGTVMLILNVYHASDRWPFGDVLRPRFPAYSTGAGKAILAWLPEEELKEYLKQTELRALTQNTITDPKELEADLRSCRERGYSIDNEENLKGVKCLSAPIFDQTARCVGAVSVNTDLSVLDDNKQKEVIREVTFTAEEISRSMGYVRLAQSGGWITTGKTDG